MLTGGHQRRGTLGTIRSIKNAFGMGADDDHFDFMPSYSHQLTHLHLPPSLPNLDHFSPSFWIWINNGEYLKADEIGQPPTVITPAGEPITALPKHLNEITCRTMTHSDSNSSLNKYARTMHSDSSSLNGRTMTHSDSNSSLNRHARTLTHSDSDSSLNKANLLTEDRPLMRSSTTKASMRPTRKPVDSKPKVKRFYLKCTLNSSSNGHFLENPSSWWSSHWCHYYR